MLLSLKMLDCFSIVCMICGTVDSPILDASWIKPKLSIEAASLALFTLSSRKTKKRKKIKRGNRNRLINCGGERIQFI